MLLKGLVGNCNLLQGIRRAVRNATIARIRTYTSIQIYWGPVEEEEVFTREQPIKSIGNGSLADTDWEPTSNNNGYTRGARLRIM